MSILCNYETQMTQIIKIQRYYKKNIKNVCIEIIEEQIDKENKNNIWINSKYYFLTRLEINNIGLVGEKFIKEICHLTNIKSCFDKNITQITKNIDGLILNKTIKIRTARLGNVNPSFQHELGDEPWTTEYIIFVDFTPLIVYITIFKNFNENFYKSKEKCIPYFPTKKFTWRKQNGSFKLDTSIKINEINIKNGYSIKYNNNKDLLNIKNFIINSFNYLIH